MAERRIVFALANPDPRSTRPRRSSTPTVVATGRSDFPNQINNVLAFPGVFRGLLDAQSTEITPAMLLAAAKALASVVDRRRAQRRLHHAERLPRRRAPHRGPRRTAGRRRTVPRRSDDHGSRVTSWTQTALLGSVSIEHTRPLVIIPARFSEDASALRYQAEVAAAKLLEAVWDAGGEPLVVHPTALQEPHVDTLQRRFWMADAILLPGGGDVSPRWYGQQPHPTLYNVNEIKMRSTSPSPAGRSRTRFRCSPSVEVTRWSTWRSAARWCKT